MDLKNFIKQEIKGWTRGEILTILLIWLFIVTNASGDAIAGRPGYEGFGDVRHKFLEMSNVSVVNEMVQMITAQRAYEFNSKTIQTSDNMLSTAVNLKR